MKKGLLIFILIFLFLFDITAQVPGYMGKRFTIEYTPALHPNAFSFFYSANLKYSRPIITHSVNLNIVVAKHRELSLAVRYSNRKIDNSYYKSVQEEDRVPAFERFALLEYSIAIKRFSKARFAPVGIYAKWELFYLSGKLNYDSFEGLRYDVATQSDKLFVYPGGKLEFVGGGGAYSLGKQRIFKDKFVFDFGFRSSVMFLKSASNYDGSIYVEHLSRDVREPLTAIPIMHFYAGLGFLAF